MRLVEISPEDIPDISGEVYHANPFDITYKLANVKPYPGAANVGKEATILVPAHDAFLKLKIIMDLLIGPFGCPWDKEQTHESLRKYLLEEAYEVLDAIDRKDLNSLKEELGDLILQPVFHMNLLQNNEQGKFDEPIRNICDKLIRRHPHVFGELLVDDAETVLKNWDAIKKTEKAESEAKSILSGIPASLPALARAHEVSKRAVRAGFEWPDFEGVKAKVDEELKELEEAIAIGDPEKIESELGDVLFTLVNIARWQKVDPEHALRTMVSRFQKRFEFMESHATKPLTELSLEEWDELWIEAKRQT